MQESVPQIIKILQILDEYQVKFIIVGGVCAVLHGAPVTTFDLDIVHSREPENLRRLADVLEMLNASYRGHSKQIKPYVESLASPGHHLLITHLGPLDILGTIEKGLDYAALIGHSEEIRIEGRTFRLLNLEHLIEIKKDSLFEKDRAKLPLLKQTLNEKRKHPSESEIF
jgi:predicted nucleotidyltransferase